MGLDIFVMPLYRFHSGEYAGPLEELLGDNIKRIGAPKPDAPEDLARAYVEELKQNLSREAGRPIDWRDAPRRCTALIHPRITRPSNPELSGLAGGAPR